LIQKKAGRVDQVVEHLPSKCEALSSNPNTTIKKTKKFDPKEKSIIKIQQKIHIKP
jgi:hypothetical protein